MSLRLLWNYNMNNKKFKVGDRVRIIDCASIESYELNKIGILVKIRDNFGDGLYNTYVVDMGRPRRLDANETCWYLHKEHIELVKGQQLEFDFMYK